MLLLFFGTDEFASGIAVDRKVTLMARTLSDLTSQNIRRHRYQVDELLQRQRGDHDALFGDAAQIDVTELYVDPATKVARVQWSKGDAQRAVGTTVAIPTALQIGGTYLIYSEVSYAFVPTVGYVLKNSITLSDHTFTRPRQSTCVIYGTYDCTPI